MSEREDRGLNHPAREDRRARRKPMAGPLKTLLDGLAFPEGPRWRDGELYFSDMHFHEVVAMTPTGARRTHYKHHDAVSGLGWLPDGRMLVVSMIDRRLLRLE